MALFSAGDGLPLSRGHRTRKSSTYRDDDAVAVGGEMGSTRIPNMNVGQANVEDRECENDREAPSFQPINGGLHHLILLPVAGVQVASDRGTDRLMLVDLVSEAGVQQDSARVRSIDVFADELTEERGVGGKAGTASGAAGGAEAFAGALFPIKSGPRPRPGRRMMDGPA